MLINDCCQSHIRIPIVGIMRTRPLGSAEVHMKRVMEVIIMRYSLTAVLLCVLIFLSGCFHGRYFGVVERRNKCVLSDPANDFKVTIVNKSGEKLGIVFKGRAGVVTFGYPGRAGVATFRDPEAHKLIIDTTKKSAELDGKIIPYSNRGKWILTYGSLIKVNDFLYFIMR